MRDAQTLLLRALRTCGEMPPVRLAHCEAWASATFSGARHRLELEPVAASRADGFATQLVEADYKLPGHLVADITIAARTVSPEGVALTVEALTVEDG